jgi:hypothetical protein
VLLFGTFVIISQDFFFPLCHSVPETVGISVLALNIHNCSTSTCYSSYYTVGTCVFAANAL